MATEGTESTGRTKRRKQGSAALEANDEPGAMRLLVESPAQVLCGVGPTLMVAQRGHCGVRCPLSPHKYTGTRSQAGLGERGVSRQALNSWSLEEQLCT